MKTEKNILAAFLLNLLFSLFEFAGGVFTGSVAILSDAVHDVGDAAGIGISYFLEKKSKRPPDEAYTYGYARLSVLGGVLTALFLFISSAFVIFHAVSRMFHPVAIDYSGMIGFAVVGVCVNFCAAWITHKGDSYHQKTVNLHMLEDVMGWLVVLVGAVIMRFTDFALIDPIMSAGVAVYIGVNAVIHLKEGVGIFLEKVPCGISADKVRESILAIPGVSDIRHIHIWSMDGTVNCATIHIVTDADSALIKKMVREKLSEWGIGHVTLETEGEKERCERCFFAKYQTVSEHRHHH